MELLNRLTKLYKDKKQIELLSSVYILLAFAFVIVAGLVALVNQSVGVALLIIPLVSIIALCMNVTAWSLIRFALDTINVRVKEKQSTKKNSKQ